MLEALKVDDLDRVREILGHHSRSIWIGKGESQVQWLLLEAAAGLIEACDDASRQLPEHAKSQDALIAFYLLSLREVDRLQREFEQAAADYVDVQGTEIVMHYPDGRQTPMEVREGQELQVGRALVIPPYGTSQRKYVGTLGSNRLYLGDGYGIHGTDAPTSIGRDASHGCVRVRNEDAELLFRIVPVGTAVYIY